MYEEDFVQKWAKFIDVIWGTICLILEW
jgi:hypothetical protein